MYAHLSTTLETTDVPRLVLAGELDIATAPHLRRAIRDAFESAGVNGKLDLVCREVDFIDGAGVGAVLSARRWAAGRDASMAIVDPSRQCRRLFEILQLEHLVTAA
jgi:anti-anti-sigma factor